MKKIIIGTGAILFGVIKYLGWVGQYAEDEMRNYKSKWG